MKYCKSLKVYLVRVISLLIVSGVPAWCGSTITSLTGQIQITSAPGSLVPGANENDLKAMLFMEETDMTFASAITVDASQPGSYASQASLTAGSIAAGTVISSTYFHADPVAATGTRYIGSIAFENEILGIIFSSSTLFQTDAILGDPELVYGNYTDDRGLELSSAKDQLFISDDRRTLVFSVMSWQTADDFRIITEGHLAPSTANSSGTPESGTIRLLALGLALIALGWRRAKR